MTFQRRSVHAVEEDEHSSPESEVEYVMKLDPDGRGRNNKSIMANMVVEDKVVKFQVDSGASVNVIPRTMVPNALLEPCDTMLKTWNSSSIKPIGKSRIVIRNSSNQKKYSIEFIIVEQDFTPLLGKAASEQMELITVNYDNINAISVIPKGYEEVFRNEVGTLPGMVHLTVDETVQPYAIAKCRIPVSLKKKVEKKLKEMAETNIIEKVDEPTEWVSRMVTSMKRNGDIRICIDPQALNLALKREMHPLPIIEDVLPELSSARVFSKFDLRSGYWHCILDEASSRLTTFQTPFGRYKWNRLPFGLAVSSEIFQKRLISALDGLRGVICVADDILVYGVGPNDEVAEKDHDENLEMMLKRCKEKSIRLNDEKTEMKKKEVLFLGHKITSRGLEVDPSKVEAIVKLEAPQNITEIQRLGGMVNYLAKFLPQLSEVMEPIRKLTIKDVPWIWEEEQMKAFEKIKMMVTNTPLLAYYDQTKPLIIQCDASKSGLGAVLLQNKVPICYASKSLTPTETRYAVIEKEMLAVTFALHKFHQYTFGRHTTIHSDHKPLQSILKKPLDSAPKRLQGMILSTQQYDFDLEYRPGKEMHIADFLSRAPMKSTEGIGVFDYVNAVKFLPIREERLKKIRDASQDDDVMQALIHAIQNGWPEDKVDAPPLVTAYFHCRDELVIHDGLVFKGDRVIIPKSLRSEMKEAIHFAHVGIEGCLRRARECIYWPGMTGELKSYIQMCETCNKYHDGQKKETLMSHEVSDRPWEKIGVDLMEVNNKHFLVTVDYFSNFWEVDELSSTKASSVIRRLKSHFARYGAPTIVISDNGPQFYCEEFGEFAKEWNFAHRTSSPGHARSNGQAESAVKTSKKIIIKALESGRDPLLAMLDCRNTPTESGLRPVQKFFGRRTRTLLPTAASLLTPKGINATEIKTLKRINNAKYAHYYDRYSKDMEALEEGDIVRVKPMSMGGKVWKKNGLSTKGLTVGHTRLRPRMEY